MEKSKNVFYLDPDYENFVPRKTHLKYQSVGIGNFALVLFSISTILFGCVVITLIFLAVTNVTEYWHFNLNGVDTTATITSCETRNDRFSTLEISYEYFVETEVYQTYSLVNKDYNRCELFPTGNQVHIQYSSRNPSRSHLNLPSEGTSWFSTLLSILGFVCLMPIVAIFTFFSAWIAVSEVHSRYKYVQLRSKGIVLEGTVLHAEYEQREGRYSRKSYVPAIKAEFETPDGRLITRTFRGEATDIRFRAVPQKGTTVMVLYADDHAVMML